VHGKVLAPLAHPLGSALGAFGQQVADPLASGDLFDEGSGGLVVAEGEFQPVALLLAQDPPLVALHGPAHHDAGAHRIHAQLVATLCQVDDGWELTNAAVGPQRKERLIIQAGDGSLVLTLSCFRPLLAGDGAPGATHRLDGIVFVHVLAAHLLGVLEHRLTEVASR